MMTNEQSQRLTAMIEQYSGLVELLPAGGEGKVLFAHNDGEYIVMHDPGPRRHRQTRYRGHDLDVALVTLDELAHQAP